MKQAAVSKLRQTERAARSRRRDMLLGAASLALHIVVFLLLPSLAVHAELPRELLIELVRPVAPAGAPTTQPATTPEPAPELLTDAADAAETPAQADAVPVPSPAPPEPTPQPEEQTAPAQDSVPIETPVAEANEATSISRALPVVATESPVAVEEPVEQAPAPVADERVEAAPQPAASAPVEETPPVSSPSETDTNDDAPEVSTGDEDAADDADSADDDAAQDDDASQAPAADPGPPAPPPGPSEYELRLLGEYGDAARLRIRSQARNPEQDSQGIVTFEFEVARDGHLIDVWVIESSGYTNIDTDAMEAARAAFNERAEKKPFPDSVSLASWVFVMSLKYPLY